MYNIHQNKPTHPKTRLPNYTHTFVKYTVGVCVNERESVTKFHFRFGNVARPPVRRLLGVVGAVSSETDIFTFNVARFFKFRIKTTMLFLLMSAFLKPLFGQY